jgi:hypothetical protein
MLVRSEGWARSLGLIEACYLPRGTVQVTALDPTTIHWLGDGMVIPLSDATCNQSIRSQVRDTAEARPQDALQLPQIRLLMFSPGMYRLRGQTQGIRRSCWAGRRIKAPHTQLSRRPLTCRSIYTNTHHLLVPNGLAPSSTTAQSSADSPPAT